MKKLTREQLDAAANDIEAIAAKSGIALTVSGGTQQSEQGVVFFDLIGRNMNQVVANALACHFNCRVEVHDDGDDEYIRIKL